MIQPPKAIEGVVDGIKYSIDESIVKDLKEQHNISAIQKIEYALKKIKE
jgi:hypothetical protein